jgi:hypothetical protein
MLPDEMEAEKNRKMILAQADEIEILKRNVNELQAQLNAAHKRIASQSEDWGGMRDKLDSALIHNKRLIEQNAEAMVIIGHKQQELDAMEESECFCGLADEPVMATEDI